MVRSEVFMSAMKLIAIIAGITLIFFGILFIWAAFGEVFNSGWLVTGLISVLIGFGLIAISGLVGRQKAATASGAGENVTLKIDLPANVNLDTLKCKSCGGALTTDNIQMVAGAPVVTCPYCNTVYQLKEEPKW
jgi:hypothetical protein